MRVNIAQTQKPESQKIKALFARKEGARKVFPFQSGFHHVCDCDREERVMKAIQEKDF